jgi:UDP-N-acetylmuramate: L-alanyl-gamma-D-glutamyl-meso-diaminopimelate ligase
MPKSFFSIQGCSPIPSIANAKKIHFCGIAGVAMSQLAAELQRQGFQVSGSDVACYPPADQVLREAGISFHEGYSRTAIPEDVSLVVIGNAISYGNEEVSVVEERNLPYTCFPQALADVLLAHNKHSIVVSGTHGKTTTAAACAFALQQLDLEPGYFVGGVIPQLPTGLAVGAGTFCVFEGDEYDSGFFAKIAKFHFYKPTILIITSLEFDHADIYADLDAVVNEFRRLLSSLAQGTPVIACADYDTIVELSAEFSNLDWVLYGTNENAEIGVSKPHADTVHLTKRTLTAAGTKLQPETTVGKTQLSGMHNALNYAAIVLALQKAKIPVASSFAALANFKGVLRRQQVRFDGNITLVEDFAHHPRAVRETLFAMRERYGARRLIAIFEPRSHTSRKNTFQQDYAASFSSADGVVIQKVLLRALDKPEEVLNTSDLVLEIAGRSGCKFAIELADHQEIKQWCRTELRDGDVVILMSNGSFGGLVSELESELKVRASRSD